MTRSFTGNEVDIAVLGTDGSVQMTNGDTIAGEFGLGYHQSLASGVMIDFGISGMASDDGSTGVGLNFGISVDF